jgi:hypothetical protein
MGTFGVWFCLRFKSSHAPDAGGPSELGFSERTANRKSVGVFHVCHHLVRVARRRVRASFGGDIRRPLGAQFDKSTTIKSTAMTNVPSDKAMSDDESLICSSSA